MENNTTFNEADFTRWSRSWAPDALVQARVVNALEIIADLIVGYDEEPRGEGMTMWTIYSDSKGSLRVHKVSHYYDLTQWSVCRTITDNGKVRSTTAYVGTFTDGSCMYGVSHWRS